MPLYRCTASLPSQALDVTMPFSEVEIIEQSLPYLLRALKVCKGAERAEGGHGVAATRGVDGSGCRQHANVPRSAPES